MPGQYAKYPASTGGGGGTVTSVGFTASPVFTVTGSPITTSGTISLTLAPEPANTVFAGPTSGGPGTPSFRPLVVGDIPALPYAQDSFTIIQTDLGTSPTATSATDTLTLHSGSTNFTVTGNSGTKTVTYNILSGDLTDSGTDGIVITGGTGAVLGSGTSIAQTKSDATHNGYLSSTDWSTFNNKQPAGNYITALTGDATATGPGSVPLTLATVNSNVGTFLYPQITVNAKGLVTAASTPTQSANTVFAGPTSGAAAIPTFRSTVLADLPVASGFSFLTAGTTYTTPSTINTNTLFKFTLIGGGGGGGGLNTNTAHAPGGGAGGTCIVWLTGLSPSTGYTMAIGAGGTAGTGTPTAGGAGGSTTISINATTYTANGGSGGPATVTSNGGAGGTATNGTINITGENGGSVGGASNVGSSGRGGSTSYGSGGASINPGPGTGISGTGYGSGGSGAAGTASSGGAGAQGMILVEWSV